MIHIDLNRLSPLSCHDPDDPDEEKRGEAEIGNGDQERGRLAKEPKEKAVGERNQSERKESQGKQNKELASFIFHLAHIAVRTADSFLAWRHQTVYPRLLP